MGPPFSSCGALRPSAKGCYALRAKKGLYMLFSPVLDHFSKLSNFKKKNYYKMSKKKKKKKMGGQKKRRKKREAKKNIYI